MVPVDPDLAFEQYINSPAGNLAIKADLSIRQVLVNVGFIHL